jgi:peptidoglycan/LPS O-acetylase OafA/YrhL
LPEVLFGCILGQARSVADVVAPVVIYVVCCALAALLAIQYPQAAPTALLPLKGLVVFLVLVAVVAGILPFIKNEQSGILALFGRAAFPFFLLHGIGVRFMSEKFGRNTLPWIFYFVLCWAAAIVLILALERILRRPEISEAAHDGQCRV